MSAVNVTGVMDHAAKELRIWMRDHGEDVVSQCVVADLRDAKAAVAELMAEAQRLVDGTTADLHYLRAALARCGGAA